jgi:hypothetical protein
MITMLQSICADQLKMALPVVRNYLEDINSRYKVRNNIVALVHKRSLLCTLNLYLKRESLSTIMYMVTLC